jgi:hypothetical protein
MTVEFSGPLFDGTAQQLLDKGTDAAEQAIAERVRDEVRSVVRSRADHRTGYYESRVTLDRARGNTRVTDNRARYGGWLEGVWPRNARTGFRGFEQFERALRKVEPEAAQVAERELGPYIDRMG